MRRREFIAGIGCAAAWPRSGRAQTAPRMRRIGMLQAGRNDPFAGFVESQKTGLKALSLDFVEHLDRQDATVHGIARTPDFGHAPLADPRQHLKPPGKIDFFAPSLFVEQVF